LIIADVDGVLGGFVAVKEAPSYLDIDIDGGAFFGGVAYCQCKS
jgi:hypothetical protein